MKGTILFILWLAGLNVAQDSSSRSSQSPSIVTLTGSQRQLTNEGGAVTVPSDFEGSTIATMTRSARSSITGSSGVSSGVSSGSSNGTISSENPLTAIGGSNRTRTPTASGTSPATPQNTQPCNNYLEFCNRRYSNITEVAAHNSMFTRAKNAGRNQDYGVTQQLNDGIRVLQGQAHLVNGTLRYCHSSCNLLDAGTVEAYLREVETWVSAHPFDVITIIFGNYDYEKKDANGKPLVTSSNFVDPIEKSGLMQYIYQPPKTAMTLDEWPTLGEMLLKQKRVVTFIDYNFDTDAVPWMLWQFYNVWETPYSPTNPSFPCTIDRPDGLGNEKAKTMMYMANANLNVEIAFAGINLLIPDYTALNVTNAAQGNGSVGLMANGCTATWGRPPNFLLVDFYNQGPTNGSVFEVAARANNVTYTRDCCGTASLANVIFHPSTTYFGFVVAVAVAMIL